MTFWLIGPAVLALALVWLLGPGVAMGWVVGVRGLALFALAPALSLAALGCGTVVAGWLDLPWGWPVAVGSVVLATAVAALVGWFFPFKTVPGAGYWAATGHQAVGGEWRRHGTAPVAAPGTKPEPGALRVDAGPPDRLAPSPGSGKDSRARVLERWSRRQWWVMGLTGVVSAAVILVGALVGMGGLRAVPQGWDVVFHGNLVRFILDSQNASPLHAGVLNSPGAASAYYPSGVHGMASLVVIDGQVWPGLLALQLVAGSVIWVLGVAYLMRVLFPRRVSVAVIGVALSVIGQGQPLSLVGLIPNSVGVALLPALLGWSVQVARLISWRVGGVVGRTLVLAVATIGLAMAHPIAVFSYLLLAWPIAGYIVLTLALRGWRRGWRLATIVCSAGVGLLAGLAVLALFAVPEVKAVVTGGGWANRDSPLAGLALALGDSTSLFQVGPGALITLGLVTGVVLVLRRRQQRWLVASYAGALLVYVGCVANWVWLGPITGLWYADRTRLGPLLGLAAIPLAAQGLVWLGAVIVPKVKPLAAATPAWPPEVRETPHKATSPAADGTSNPSGAVRVIVALVSLTCLVSSLSVMAQRPSRYGQYGFGWSTPTKARMFTAEELAMIRRLGPVLGAGAVLGNPANGSAYVYALTGHPVVFPHLTGVWDQPRRYLLENLPLIGADPQVCAALDQLDARYLYYDPVTWGGAERYASLTEGLDLTHGFELIDTGGTAAVYRITACG